MRIQGIIFDFDGTLADTIPLCCAAFREVAQRRLGRDYSDAEIVAMFGPSEVGIFQEVAGDRWEVCLEDFLAIYERDAIDVQLVRILPARITLVEKTNVRAGVLARVK